MHAALGSAAGVRFFRVSCLERGVVHLGRYSRNGETWFAMASVRFLGVARQMVAREVT